MVAWKINRIPTYQENTLQNNNAKNNWRQILYSLQGLSNANISLELVFSHVTGEEIDIYVFLRNAFITDIASTIEMQFTAMNYQFERLDDQSTAVIAQQLINIACTELSAIVKTEKIVTTPFMQEQYYYWADALLVNENQDLDNFTLLFQSLQKCNNSFISFQLIPTSTQDYEINVLQYLDMHLEQHIRSTFSNTYGIPMYEPYAKPAYDAYHHYIDKRGQPVYQYIISVGSMFGNGSFLANQIIAGIKAQTLNAPELQTIPVQINRQAFVSENFPFYLINLLQQQHRNSLIWGGSIIPPNQLFRFPYLVTADEALTFFRLPYDDGKIVGVKGTLYHSTNELLDSAVTDSTNIIFGKSADSEETSIGAPPKLFSQHALIVGMPGTGKTTFCINLLLQFYKKGIPFLAIEPTKAEYRAMIDAIPDLQIFTPGNNSLSPFILNPFIPPKGIPIEKYIPSLFSAFKVAFDMPSPLDAVFLKAIRTAYNNYGWRDYSQVGDSNTTPFGFHEFILVFQHIIDESDYSREVKGNLRSGGVLRLSNLIEQNRNIFDTIHSIPIEDLLRKPTVIELNAIDNPEQKALLISLLLINIAVYTKNIQTEESMLSNVILLDEAHVLLDQKTSASEGKIGSQSYAVQLVENLIAEIRSYGTSIIISDQRPSAVGEPIVANTDMKITFRLTSGREKDIICESMDLDDNMRQQLSQLEKGQAYAFYHKLTKPQMVITPDIRAVQGIRIKVPDDEILQKNSYWDTKQHLLKPFLLCKYCSYTNTCNFKLRADAEYFSNLLWNSKHRDITDAQSLWKYIYGIPSMLKSRLERYTPTERITLVKCISIALQRKAEFEKRIIIDKVKLKNALERNLEEVVNSVY